jgi:uncharacterized protein YdhG (YjbR/CyaY superfamily)
MAVKFATIDEYIGSFPVEVQAVLEEVRRRIRGALPAAQEVIRYDIPTFRINGKNVVHFAGWKQHMSIYPVPAGDEALQREIEPYRAGKGTLKFPLDQPIPYRLIERVAALLAGT